MSTNTHDAQEAGSAAPSHTPSRPLFLESEFAQRPAGDARFHVIPVPYEASVSYGGGTAGGPAAILAASNQLEVFDGQSSPGEEGIHTTSAVSCDGPPETVFPKIEEATYTAVTTGAGGFGIPVVLGGEHSITAPAVHGVRRALQERPPAAPIGVVQIDAHADLREEYDGSRFSHACVAHRLHAEMHIPLVQIGVRAISPEEMIYRSTTDTITAYDAAQIVPAGTTAVELPSTFPEHVYLTVDVDGLDPSIIPATGTPVPGGLRWYQFLSLVTSVATQRRIVGMDVVELAPIAGGHAWDYAAAEVVHRLMGIVARSPFFQLP